MSKIETELPDGAFEIIRTRIGEILAEELPIQAGLKGRSELNATVWEEREAAFTAPELPAVNVYYSMGDNDRHGPAAAHFSHAFNIDVSTAGKASGAEHGALDSQRTAQSIVNLCRAILAHSVYRTLGFEPGFIMSHGVREIAVSNTKALDGDFVTMARLTFVVVAVETNGKESARTSSGADTSTKLEGSEKGYKFVLNN